jgi:hypothetical protein
MSFDNAKLYLARVLHWPDAHEEPAFANIHWTFKKAGEDRVFWSGRACRSVKEAVGAIDYALNKRGNTLDVYACLSTQRMAQEKITQRGFKMFTPIRNQQNAVRLKCLFLDIDLKGGEHGYTSSTEAAGALGSFLTATGLPKPTLIVASGGGFHVYWTLMKPLTPEEWQPYAYALAEATKKHGLKCDTQCTVDAARVLRVPDTLNRKNADARLVSFIGTPLDFDYANDRITRCLEPYRTITPAHVGAALPQLTPIVGTSDLAAGIEVRSADPIKIKPLATECPFVREAIMTGGKDYTNPLWNLTTFIGTFCENGRAVAHLMAKGHPGYTPDSTDDLFDRKEREKAQKNLGWPSCATISAQGSKVCQGCPHFAQGKSPLNFARPPVTPQVTPQALPPADQTDMPRNYRRQPNGLISYLVTNLEGGTEEITICKYPMTDPELENNMGKVILHFMTITETGKARKVSIELGSIGVQDMRKILQNQGMMLPRKLEIFTDFMIAWVQQLQATRKAVNLITFGWALNTESDVEGFVYGDQLWTPTGGKLTATKPSRIAQHYTPKGKPEFWLSAARIISDMKRPELEAIVLSSFAAPLVRFTGHSGLIMSAYSNLSGKGKTTAMNVAQAVWGSPVHKLGLDDTVNKAGGVMADLHSLPLLWDELKDDMHLRSIISMIYRVTDVGREKGRMNQDTSFRNSGDFQSMMTVASNDSLLEWADQNMQLHNATFLRIFEYEVPDPLPFQLLDASTVQRVVAELRDHYGGMGLKYAAWLGANHARCKQEVGDFCTKLHKDLNAPQEERFWVATIGVILMAAKYVNENNWMKVDEAALYDMLVATLTDLRARLILRPGDMTKQLNAVEFMDQFIGAKRHRHLLLTNRVHVARGVPATGSIKVVGSPQNIIDVQVQVGVEDKIMRINTHHLRQWISDMGLRPHKTLQMLKEKFGFRDVVGRMAAGTTYAGMATIQMKEIDLTGQGVDLNFIDV